MNTENVVDAEIVEIPKTEEAEQPQAEPQPPKVDEKMLIQKKDIEALENGAIFGKTLEEQYRVAKAWCMSGMLPKQYDKPEKVLTAMQMAFGLGLNPALALRKIAVVNGQPSLWGELPLAVVRNSKKLEYIDEYLIDKDYNRISLENKNLNTPHWASVCKVKRIGAVEKTFTFTMEDAERMGKLLTDVWMKYPKTMFKFKARAFALKDEFGDILEGMPIAEHDWNFMPEEGGVYTIPEGGGAPQQESKLNSFAGKFKKNKDVVIEVPVEKKDGTSNS